jgi:RHS repeat-associated protein
VTTTFTWDVASNLVKTVDENDTVIQYVYGESGQRVAKIDTSHDTATMYLGSTEVTDPNTCSSSTDDLVGTRYFTFGGSTVAVRDGSEAFANSLSLQLADSQGSATVMMQVTLGGSGVMADATTSDIVTRNAYLPYGATRGGDNLDIDHGWLNQVTDESDTGLVYLNARYYDPSLGRFISPDPLVNPGDPRTLDPYRYADNNPVVYQDVSGLCSGLSGAALRMCSLGGGFGEEYAKTYAEEYDTPALIKDLGLPVTLSPSKPLPPGHQYTEGAPTLDPGDIWGGLDTMDTAIYMDTEKWGRNYTFAIMELTYDLSDQAWGEATWDVGMIILANICPECAIFLGVVSFLYSLLPAPTPTVRVEIEVPDMVTVSKSPFDEDGIFPGYADELPAGSIITVVPYGEPYKTDHSHRPPGDGENYIFTTEIPIELLMDPDSVWFRSAGRTAQGEVYILQHDIASSHYENFGFTPVVEVYEGFFEDPYNWDGYE